MKRHLPFLLTVFLIATALPSGAQVMNYQGRLTNASGDPVENVAGQPPVIIEFSLWDLAAGGTQVWGPFTLDGLAGNGKGPIADLVNGRFNSVLGPNDTAGRPLSGAFTNTTRYLQIKVGSNPAISPRQALLDAPTALMAQRIPNVWTSGANVGIGTTTPKQALHVNGDYYGKGHIWLHANEGDGASGTVYLQARDSSATSNIGLMLRTKSGAALADAMYIDPVGKVGIGTGVSDARLTVAQEGYGIQHGDGTGNVRLSTFVGGNIGYFGTRSNHPLAFYANDSGPRMTVAANGRVGIGTVTPGAALHVHNDNLQLAVSTPSYSWSFGADVNGHFYFAGPGPGVYINRISGQYTINSDRRLKKDITSVSGALDRVLKLRPVSYRFNATSSDHSKTMGFIAQEVEPVFPDLVEEATNGYKAVAYTELIPVTIAALQEEHRRNEALSQKVTTGDKEIADLKQRLERLEALVAKGSGK